MNSVTILLSHVDGTEYYYKIRSTSTFGIVMAAHNVKCYESPNSDKFIFQVEKSGRIISPDETVEELELINGDQVVTTLSN